MATTANANANTNTNTNTDTDANASNSMINRTALIENGGGSSTQTLVNGDYRDNDGDNDTTSSDNSCSTSPIIDGGIDGDRGGGADNALDSAPDPAKAEPCEENVLAYDGFEIEIDDDGTTTTPTSAANNNNNNNQPQIRSMASRVASIEDFDKVVETCLPSRLLHAGDQSGSPMPQEKMLSRLDGIHSSALLRKHPPGDASSNEKEPAAVINGVATTSSNSELDLERVPVQPVRIRSMEVAAEQDPEDVNTIGSWFTFFMGSISNDENDDHRDDNNNNNNNSHNSHNNGPSLASPIVPSYQRVVVSGSNHQHRLVPAANKESEDGPVHPQSVTSPMMLSFPEAVRAYRREHDTDRNNTLPNWVDNKFAPREQLPKDGTYRLGDSKTIVVHEIARGNWTWCTAWSPDGTKLAIATENHHLAVVDTTVSCVWRVAHDKVVRGPQKEATTQSIRSIAWGEHFLAIGGIGNALSILAPTEPYPILHTIHPTGFVGSIDWLGGSNKLLVGSRNGTVTIHEVWENHDPQNTNLEFQTFPTTQPQSVREIKSKVIHTIDRGMAWVNAVQFQPMANFFAMGDSHGILSVYEFESATMKELTNVANFRLEDSILDIQWSPDGNYLYAAGEDFAITVISTRHWEPVHKIKRDRWVQFVASSKGSTHLAVGGVTSEVSILEVKNGWDNIINVGLKGLVPLSASWHPDDKYLVLTGQNHSILAIETTNVRHVSGHFLRSASPILSIAFSPDGRMAAIGNEMGVVGIFLLSGTTFISVYEMVVDLSGSLSIEWSPNGSYVAIAAGNKVVVVARTEALPGSAPPNTSGFFVSKVVRDLGLVRDVSIDPTSRFLAVSGSNTRVLHATSNFKNVLEMENGGTTLANSWSNDGRWFAAIGKDHSLVIYDTSHTDLSQWQSVFTVKTEGAGLALAWGKASSSAGLQYCAYGGEDKQIHIMEIRTKERSWETVLTIPRDGEINDLDWNRGGLLAAAISNGTVTVVDLSYLQSGWAVNEMDYNWQRQALTCYTEIRRNKGKHSMKIVRWIPSASEESDCFLAIGGTDGEVEIIDLTQRDNCVGLENKLESNDFEPQEEESSTPC